MVRVTFWKLIFDASKMFDGRGALEADDRLLFAVTTGMAQEGYNCDVLLYCKVLGNGDWG